MPSTRAVNVARIVPLAPPQRLLDELPATPLVEQNVLTGRDTIRRMLTGDDLRMLMIVGPCSIHDPKAALEYAERLARLSRQVQDRLVLVMRVYFEKPRTTIGWKGLINDPHLDGTFDVEEGLRQARRILLAVNQMGLFAATEMLEPITPQYVGDLVSWAAIGARTTESQTHRQMASGLSMPVGFKNGTDGNLQIALDAMLSARHEHRFLGIDIQGQTCVVHARGNPWGHLILRGGRSGPNYDRENLRQAVEALRQAQLPDRVMIDCSHANSDKDHRKQELVWDDVIAQRVEGNTQIFGLMLESNLVEGAQKLGRNLAELKYGVSITDACTGWEQTETMILRAHAALAESLGAAAS